MKEYQPKELTSKHRAILVELRPARESDSELLFKWRIAAQTKEEHERWMSTHVYRGYPVHLVMLGGSEGIGPIGAVRFDMARDDVMTYAVSVTVAPEHRNKGLGTMMLMAACDFMDENTLTAEAKANSPAAKLLKACGFVRTYNNNYKKGPA